MSSDQAASSPCHQTSQTSPSSLATMPSNITTNTGNNAYLARVYSASDSTSLRTVYDDWSHVYDADMKNESINYVAPDIAVKKILLHLQQSESENHETSEVEMGEAGTLGGPGAALGNKVMLDAGCGTGLVGVKLAEAGAKIVDGVDLSEGMLSVAAKAGVYRELGAADLSKPIEKGDATYDVLVCVGTLTHGHVGPTPALGEFLRIIKSGGLVVATVLEDIWESGGYKAEVERLQTDGKVEVLETGLEDYRRGGGVQAVMLVMRVK